MIKEKDIKFSSQDIPGKVGAQFDAIWYEPNKDIVLKAATHVYDLDYLSEKDIKELLIKNLNCEYTKIINGDKFYHEQQ